MNEFRARIGRVRMKNGGADIRIVDGFRMPQEDESPDATLLRCAREFVEEEGTAAFLVVGWGADGKVLFNWRYTDDCPMARTLMPSYIAELTRRYVITTHEAEERFHEMFEWVE